MQLPHMRTHTLQTTIPGVFYTGLSCGQRRLSVSHVTTFRVFPPRVKSSVLELTSVKLPTRLSCLEASRARPWTTSSPAPGTLTSRGGLQGLLRGESPGTGRWATPSVSRESLRHLPPSHFGFGNLRKRFPRRPGR